jgi:hypothetical protein
LLRNIAIDIIALPGREIRCVIDLLDLAEFIVAKELKALTRGKRKAREMIILDND